MPETLHSGSSSRIERLGFTPHVDCSVTSSACASLSREPASAHSDSCPSSTNSYLGRAARHSHRPAGPVMRARYPRRQLLVPDRSSQAIRASPKPCPARPRLGPGLAATPVSGQLRRTDFHPGTSSAALAIPTAAVLPSMLATHVKSRFFSPDQAQPTTQAAGGAIVTRLLVKNVKGYCRIGWPSCLTSWQNFLHTGRTASERVAENIMTCFCGGVALKICCRSRRMSGIPAATRHAQEARRERGR